MSHDTVTAFEPAIAGTLEAVPEAMTRTHDALIRRWGRKRRGGVVWELFGPELAAYTARQLVPAARHVAGTIEQGLTKIEVLAASSDGHDPDPTLRTKLDGLHQYALEHQHPTLIIAYCEIRAPRRNHQ